MNAPSCYLTRTHNHIICKYIAEFHPEEHADLVVSQLKSSSPGHSNLIYIVKRNTKTDGMGQTSSVR